MPDSETVLCLAVSTQYRRVTDGRTDRQTDGHLATSQSTPYAYASRGKKGPKTSQSETLVVIVTSAKAEVMRSVVFVCHSFCHSSCLSACRITQKRSNQPISLKLVVMTGPTNRKNLSTSGADPIDPDSLQLPDQFPLLSPLLNRGVRFKLRLGPNPKASD